jgi:hypothetical protein
VSPIDLLDKRFYVPTIKNLKFFTLDSCNLDVYSDSIFYKKIYIKLVDSQFMRSNLFFSDKLRYTNNSLSFLNYQVPPTKMLLIYFF